MQKSFHGRREQRISEMNRKLAAIELDGEARIGTMVFPKGTPINVLVEHAQSHFRVPHTPGENAPLKTSAHSDPWVAEMYNITTEYHIRTNKKVQIGDLMEAFFVQSMKDIEPGDRDAFEARLRERLAD